MNTVTFTNGTDVYGYDAAGRVDSIVDSVGTGSVTYNPTWNSNGTLSSFQVADSFHPGQNKTCNYTYDDTARLVKTDCGTAGSQTYLYDQFSNISKTANGYGGTFQALYNNNNQVTNMAFVYDADGRITSDGVYAYGYGPVYGNLTTSNGSTITYDGLDRAVEIATTPVLYSPIGKLGLVPGGAYNIGAEIRIPTPVGDLQYLKGVNAFARVDHPDWLGSKRFVTNPHTNTSAGGADYTPFGEIQASWGSTRINFTGQDQDIGPVGTYDLPARKYSALQSRWISPDPTIGSISSPQTFNKYAFARSNPLKLIDRLGFDGNDDGWTNCDNGGCPDDTPKEDAAYDVSGLADLISGRFELNLERCPQCIKGLQMAGLMGGTDPGNSRQGYDEARYQNQVDNAFNGTNFPFVPSLSELQPGSGILPVVRVPGGSIWGSFVNQFGNSGRFLLGTVAEEFVPQEIWNGYADSAVHQVWQWWNSNSYYHLGLSQEDARANELAYRVSVGTSNISTPCDGLQVGSTLLSVEAGYWLSETLGRIAFFGGNAGNLAALGCQ